MYEYHILWKLCTHHIPDIFFFFFIKMFNVEIFTFVFVFFMMGTDGSEIIETSAPGTDFIGRQPTFRESIMYGNK